MSVWQEIEFWRRKEEFRVIFVIFESSWFFVVAPRVCMGSHTRLSILLIFITKYPHKEIIIVENKSHIVTVSEFSEFQLYILSFSEFVYQKLQCANCKYRIH